jgi:hypothetical protein
VTSGRSGSLREWGKWLAEVELREGNGVENPRANIGPLVRFIRSCKLCTIRWTRSPTRTALALELTPRPY